MKKILILVLLMSLAMVACTAQPNEVVNEETTATETPMNEEAVTETEEETETEMEEETTEQFVNLYTDRHYDTDQALYDAFEAETGIKVNVVKAKSDQLLERLNIEGEATEADLVVTSDVGRLYRAKEAGLIMPFDSEVIMGNVPENLRDVENFWTALTVRARIIAYVKGETDPAMLSTYEALAGEDFMGDVVIRSSSNIYNQSLVASLIELNGEEATKEWAKGMVKNMARTPEGNDRDQMKAIVGGQGKVAVVNTYYVGKLLNSSDPYEVGVGEKIGVFFPNQETTGTHINVSGAGLTKHGKNTENAVKLMEFLTGEAAQSDYANANYEYPVNVNVQPSELLMSWGEFKRQDINLEKLGEFNADALKLMNEAGWQ